MINPSVYLSLLVLVTTLSIPLAANSIPSPHPSPLSKLNEIEKNALLRKLEYDCHRLRQAIAKVYMKQNPMIGNPTRAFDQNQSSNKTLLSPRPFTGSMPLPLPFSQSRLLRLESRILNLRAMLSRHKNRKSLAYVRDSLIRLLYTDGGMLTIGQRRCLNERLYRIYFLIAKQKGLTKP